jgi:hypothetical protein
MSMKKPPKKAPAEAGAEDEDTAPAAAPVIDWLDLMRQAKEADAPISDELLTLWKRGVVDEAGRGWAEQYVHAVQRAVEGNRRNVLVAMLRASIPVPTFLLPALSLAFEPTSHRPKALTVQDDEFIRSHFDHTVALGRDTKEYRETIAAFYGVSTKIIAQSLARTRRE